MLLIPPPPALKFVFESGEQTLTLGGAVSVSHGLGKLPPVPIMVLRCKTAQLGYVAGDEVPYLGQMADGTYGANYGAALFATATVIGFVVGATGGPILLNKSTGASGAITLANWKVVLRAYA